MKPYMKLFAVFTAILLTAIASQADAGRLRKKPSNYQIPPSFTAQDVAYCKVAVQAEVASRCLTKVILPSGHVEMRKAASCVAPEKRAIANCSLGFMKVYREQNLSNGKIRNHETLLKRAGRIYPAVFTTSISSAHGFRSHLGHCYVPTATPGFPKSLGFNDYVSKTACAKPDTFSYSWKLPVPDLGLVTRTIAVKPNSLGFLNNIGTWNKAIFQCFNPSTKDYFLSRNVYCEGKGGLGYFLGFEL